jgi:hypothetical protein
VIRELIAKGVDRLDRHLAVNGLRQLDRYVLGTWLRLFVMAALGLPLIAIFFNLTDMLSKLLDRGLTMREIVISYVYAIPEYAFLVMPAAVLLATVFTVVGMGRHSELTAAKAGGQSFHRLMRPLFIAAALAAVLAFGVGELAPWATARQPSRLARHALGSTSCTAAMPVGSLPCGRWTLPAASSSKSCSSGREPGWITPAWS